MTARPADLSPLTRVLVLGADSLERTRVERWGREGHLPNLMALAKRSMIATTVNPQALESSSVWPTFHFGLQPGFHPHYDGPTVYDPESYGFALPPATDVPPPIWSRLSRAGQRCAVIDPPYCAQAEDINGIAVIDWSPHVSADGTDVHTFRTVPPSFKAEVLACVGPDPAGGQTCDACYLWDDGDFLSFLSTTLGRVEKRGRLARHILQKGEWDYVEVVFVEPHCIGHQCWHLTDEDDDHFDAERRARIGDPVLEVYAAVDREIGKILELIDERTHVLFFASHGMGPQITGTGLLDRLLMAYEGTADPNWREHLRRAFRPLWRALPVPVRRALLPSKNWVLPIQRSFSLAGNRAGRRCFEVLANNRSGGVRLNVRGRDSHGLVAPEDYDRVLEDIAQFLKDIVHDDTGEPLVADILKTRDHYRGPFVNRMPDLLVTWSRRPIRAVRSPQIGKMTQKYYAARSGDHTPQGFFFASGAGLGAGDLNASYRPEDFQPTIEQWLGLPATAFPDGGGAPIAALLTNTPKSSMEPA